MIERRKYPRLVFNIEVEYNKISQDYPVSVVTLSKNIGSGGICIICLEKGNDKVNVGDNLNLRFSLPDGNEVINVKGIVIWVEEYFVGDISSSKAYDVGIEFTSIQDTDRAKIEQFVYKGIK